MENSGNLVHFNKTVRSFPILLGIILCVIGTQCGWFARRHPVPEDLGQRIKGICEQYPPPNNFKPLGEIKSITKSDRGTYGGWYVSTTKPSELKEYYSRLLSHDNWNLKEEESSNILNSAQTRYVTFEKDGFHIALEFKEDQKTSDDEERVYGINCGFQP